MRRNMMVAGALCAAVLTGCVSAGAHRETVDELEQGRKATVQTEAAFELSKKQAAAEKQKLTGELSALQQEKDRLTTELKATQVEASKGRASLQDSQKALAAEQAKRDLEAGLTQDLTKTQASLEHVQQALAAEQQAKRDLEAGLTQDLAKARSDAAAGQKALTGEQETRRDLEARFNTLTGEHKRLDQAGQELRRDRDQLQNKVEDAQRRIETAQQELSGTKQRLTEADKHIAALDKEKGQLTTTLAETQHHARDLATQLSAEQAKVAVLQEDRQGLLGGTTTARDEIARLQKRTGELETQAARAADLDKRLSEQDQEVGKLRQATADRDSLAAKAASLAEELDTTKQRLSTVTHDLATLSDEAARTKQERDHLAAEFRRLEESGQLTAQDLEQSKQAHHALLAQLQQQADRLKAEASEKTRLERERAEKEAEIQRLAKTREDLAKSLQAEIAKGDIRLRQVKDQLTIDMVDRVLFDSGQAQVKPAGVKVLKQVSDILKHVTDKQVRIEGHTDNVPIGPKIKERFATNWELSTARATSVVRYVVEEGGVNRANVSAVGYAETRPVAANETDEGKQANRRIEIVLYPKDLKGIAGQIKP